MGRRRAAELGRGPDGESVETGSVRHLVRRSTLPSGRAIAGGLLVALSGLGLFTAQRSAAEGPGTEFVVATADIAAGERIAAHQLGVAPLDLVDEREARAVMDPDQVVGRIALTPIRRHTLVDRRDVGDAPAREDGPERRVTIEVEPARALDGALRSGDVVDIVATGSEHGSTQVIIDGALVERVGDEGDDGIGRTHQVRLTLVVADELAATTLIDAAAHQEVTLMTSSPVRMGRS